MLVDKIFEKILIRSGQFLMNVNNIELNQPRFRVLLEDALATYSKFSPYEHRIDVRIFEPRSFNLTAEFIQGITGKEYLGEPDWVSECSPVRELAINPFFIFKQADPTYNPELQNKSQVPYLYRKPRLTVPFGAQWDVLCVFKHRIFEKQLSSGVYEYSVPTLDYSNDVSFFKYVQGLFLQGLGKSRRAFTMTDLPITMDSAELVAEGVTMEQEAKDEMELNQKFYLSY